MFKNVASQKVTLVAVDTSTGLLKSGEAANITPYVSKDDGTVTALAAPAVTEKSAVNARGSYDCTLSQAETNADKLHFSGKCSTANIDIIPVTIYTIRTVDGLHGADLIQAMAAVLLGVSQAHVIQVATLVGTVTGGTFRLSYDGQATSALAYNASAATVEAALEALSTIGTGNVDVSGSAGGPYTITLGGTLDLDDLSKMTATDSLTGTNANVEIDTSVRFMLRDGTTPAFLQTYGQVPGTRVGSLAL